MDIGFSQYYNESAIIKQSKKNSKITGMEEEDINYLTSVWLFDKLYQNYVSKNSSIATINISHHASLKISRTCKEYLSKEIVKVNKLIEQLQLYRSSDTSKSSKSSRSRSSKSSKNSSKTGLTKSNKSNVTMTNNSNYKSSHSSNNHNNTKSMNESTDDYHLGAHSTHPVDTSLNVSMSIYDTDQEKENDDFGGGMAFNDYIMQYSVLSNLGMCVNINVLLHCLY